MPRRGTLFELEVKKANNRTFKDIWNFITNSMYQGTFILRKRGLYFKAMDPEQVELVDLRFKEDFFKKMKIKKTVVFVTDLMQVNKCLTSFGDVSEAKIIMMGVGEDLKLQLMTPDFKKIISIPNFEILDEMQDIPTPNISYRAQFEQDPEIMSTVLHSVVDTFDVLQIFYDGDLEFVAESEVRIEKITLGRISVEPVPPATHVPDFETAYSIEHLYLLFKNLSRHTDKALMRIAIVKGKRGGAMRISFETKYPFDLDVYLAPRVRREKAEEEEEEE